MHKSNKVLILLLSFLMIFSQFAGSLNVTAKTVETAEMNSTEIKVVDIAAGNHFTVAVKEDGSVWSWGQNNVGQLGLNNTDDQFLPKQIEDFAEVKAVSAGGSTVTQGDSAINVGHVLALKEDGTVWSWGFNEQGQLGDGTSSHKGYPVQVSNLTDIIAIASGSNHSLALKADGTVWSWGNNTYGQLGDGTNEKRTKPVQVKGLENIVKIFSGVESNSSFAVAADGKAYAWGSNWGRLGVSSVIGNENEPVEITAVNDISTVASGENHTIITTNDGRVFAWGDNFKGRLGIGNDDAQESPVQLGDVPNFESILSSNHTLALTSEGSLWSWGYNAFGMLGNHSQDDSATPIEIQEMPAIKKIAIGNSHSVALSEDGDVFTWGMNYFGQLGIEEAGIFASPQKIEISNTVTVTGLSLDANEVRLNIGESHKIKVIAQFSNGTSEDVTEKSNYQSSNTDIAAISKKGVVNAIKEGVTSIYVTYQGETVGLAVTVKKPIDNLQQAIVEAVKSIENLPSNLTYSNKGAAIEARKAVSTAVDLGAKLEDITNLQKLLNAESKIVEMDKALEEAIAAITALPKLDEADSSHREDVIAVRAQVQELIAIGVPVTYVENLVHLVELEKKLNIETGEVYELIANAGYDITTVTGKMIKFDGTFSKDRKNIVRYEWDFGDGKKGEGSTPQHTYNEPGQYPVQLTVYDSKGLSHSHSIKVTVISTEEVIELNVKVIDKDNQAPLAKASVVFELPDGTVQKVLSDNQGVVTLVADPGDYRVHAYKDKYTPSAIDVKFTKEKTETYVIELEKGEVVIGEIEANRMTLSEIKAAGIDTNDPANQWVYKFKVHLSFKNKPVENEFFVNTKGIIGGFPFLIGSGIGSLKAYPSAIVHPDRPNVRPTISYMIIPGEARWLKEFFEVSLVMENTADEQYILKDSVAKLNLPSGLTLAPTPEPQSLEIDLGEISGGKSATANWIIRGDRKGEYFFNAEFNGILSPFNDPVKAIFQTKDPIKVWGDDAIHMFVQAQGWAHEGQPYMIKFGIQNISDAPVYNLSVGIEPGVGYKYSGGTQSISELHPGGIHWFNFSVISEVEGLLDLENSFIVKTGGNASISTSLNCIQADCGVENYRPTHPFFRFMESYISDPIDSATGAYVYERKIHEVNGARDLPFTINYNSLLLNQGNLGNGWTHDYEAKLEKWSEDHIFVYWNANHTNVFNKHSDGQFYPQHQSVYFDRLKENSDGTFTLTKKDQTVYSFNDSGQLIQVADKNGRELDLQYKDEQLIKITEPISNASIELQYNADKLISKIQDQAERTVSFLYDDQGNLESFKDAAGFDSKFVYNEENRIIQAFDSDGVQLLENSYDSQGRVETQKDALGNVTQLQYERMEDTGYMVTTVTDRNGEKRVFTHNTLLQPVLIRDEKGNVTTYEYSGDGNLIGKTDRNGHKVTNSYDSQGNVTSMKDAKGHVTEMSYDARNNLLSLERSGVPQAKYEYNDRNQMTVKVDGDGNKTQYFYDENGWLVSSVKNGETTKFNYSAGKLHEVTDPEGNKTTFQYNHAGLISQKTNEAGNTEKFVYDDNNRLISVSDPSGNTKGYKYDSRGNLIEETDFKGNKTRYEYNGNGKLAKVVNAAGEETSFGYDKEDRITTIRDARRNETILAYGSNGELLSVTSPLGNTTKVDYDAEGNVINRYNPLGDKFVAFAYDKNYNLIGETNALDQTVNYQYDALNRLVQLTDSMGRATQLDYNNSGQVTGIVDALNGRSSQSFDPLGNRTAYIDPNGNETSYKYDKNGRLTEMRLASGRTISLGYNKQGLVSKQINGRNEETTYEYDANGQVSKTVDTTGQTAYQYDANGNVLEIKDSLGTIAYTYDELNRVTSYTDVFGNRIQYAYDPAGNLVSLTYPDGKSVRYSYDAENKLTQVKDWNGRETTYVYDSAGQLIKTIRPNGSKETRTYDKAGKILQIIDADANGSVINQYDYSYNNAGNLISEKQTGGKNAALKADAVSMTYSEDNRLNTYNGESVEYDADGNMTKGPLDSEFSTYQYNTKNQLVEAGKATYRYDANGNRVEAVEQQKVTRYAIDPNSSISKVLMETDENGTPTAYNVYGLGLIGMETAEGEYYSYHFDLRGSTKALTDESGQVMNKYEYGPYGELLYREGKVSNHFLYNGRDGVITDDNGLYYMRSRYYNPGIKRFINMDPLLGNLANTPSLNRYAYVQGNPVVFIDPTGYAPDYISFGFNAQYFVGGGVGFTIDRTGQPYFDLSINLGLEASIGLGANAGYFREGGSIDNIEGGSISVDGSIGPVTARQGFTIPEKGESPVFFDEIGAGISFGTDNIASANVGYNHSWKLK